jgi:serine/threonine protein kinase
VSRHYGRQPLPVGTMIQEYRIVDVLGIGGFGIVYKAENTYLDDVAAIKEYLPSDLAARGEGTRVTPLAPETEEEYRWGLQRFLREARILWGLGRPEPHPNIVRVTRFQEENGTAYMFMTYENGVPLARLLKERGPLPEPDLKAILFPLLDGLERVHRASVLHRDVKPANILIRDDGSPVLIDFGAAHREVADNSGSILAMYSPVYAALEQSHPLRPGQGPWTDIYSLGVTLYECVAGQRPTSAIRRVGGEPYAPAVETAGEWYSRPFLEAIDAALQLKPQDRPQSVAIWRRMLRQSPEEAPSLIFDTAETVLQPPSDQCSAPSSDDISSWIPPGAHTGAASVASGREPEASVRATPPRGSTRKPLLLAVAGLAGLTLISLGAFFWWSATGHSRRMGPLVSQPAIENPSVLPKSASTIPTGTVSARVPPARQADEIAVTPASQLPKKASPRRAPPSPSVAEPPAKPVSELDAIDPKAIARSVEGLIRQLKCAKVAADVSPEAHVALSGYVSSSGDRSWLAESTHAIQGVREVGDKLAVYPRPFCEMIGTLPTMEVAADETAAAPRLRLNKPNKVYREGEFLIIRALGSTSADGYLYIDYVDSAGEVVHMLPSPMRRENAVRAGEEVTIGDGKRVRVRGRDAQRYEIVPPHGKNLIASIWSAKPLFQTPRPEVERLQDYLPPLARALQLQIADDGHVSSAFEFITTSR